MIPWLGESNVQPNMCDTQGLILILDFSNLLPGEDSNLFQLLIEYLLTLIDYASDFRFYPNFIF